MNNNFAVDEPLVSILTPVYNGGPFLANCVDSVLNQCHKNWEYTIVNNCSTDNTLYIAQGYAKRDPRIKVISNQRFVNCEENHNIAFQEISRNSKYCKVISADDWIYPECIKKLVALADANPMVGIVGSYQRCGNEIKWIYLPANLDVISGREVCRKSLLEGAWVLGNPTSVLYRSDIVRQNTPFFPHNLPYADTSACYKYLQYCDFGFVHEVLSEARIHPEQVSSKNRKFHMGAIAHLDDFMQYGPAYLTEEEFETWRNRKMQSYYEWLGGCVFKMMGVDFWQFQRSKLEDMGCPIVWSRVVKESIRKIADEGRHPLMALKKAANVFRS